MNVSSIVFVVLSALFIGCSTKENKLEYEGNANAEHKEVAIQFDHGIIREGIPNIFRVVAQQDKSVTINDKSATLRPTKNRKPYKVNITQPGGPNSDFRFQVDDIGVIEFSINTQFGLVKKQQAVRKLPVYINLFGYGSESPDHVGVSQFRSQRRIDAVINCCNIDGRCAIDKFELVRASKEGGLEKTTNTGSDFGEKTKELIEKCQPGDLYIFRKILYKCMGDTDPVYADDLTVEIDQSGSVSYEIRLQQTGLRLSPLSDKTQ